MVSQRKPRLVEYLVFGLKKHGVPEKTSPGRIFSFRAKETLCPRGAGRCCNKVLFDAVCVFSSNSNEKRRVCDI